MTSEKTPANETDALEKKIGAIEKEVATVKVVIRRASRTRLALLLAVLLVIGGAIWMFYNLAMEFRSEETQKLFAEKASVRAKELSEKAVSSAKELAETSMPVLREAFEKQVEKDMPKYRAALDKEGVALKENLEKELDEKIRAQFDAMSAKYQAILRDEFPDLEDPELLDKMYASLTDIIDGLRKEYYNDKVASQLEGISNKYYEFELADLPKEGEPTLNMQFVASLMYLAALKIDEGSVE